MKKIFSFLTLAVTILIAYSSLQAQAPIFWEQFNGSANGWENVTETPLDSSYWAWVDNQWKWTPDGDVSDGAFCCAAGVPTAIQSETVSNGSMIFDADYYATGGNGNNAPPGPPYLEFLAHLVSPTIDLSSTTQLLDIEFTQYFRFLNDFPDGVITRLGVSWSTDDGATWSDMVDAGEGFNANQRSQPNFVKRIPLPPDVIGASQFKMRFTFHSDFYYWVLDDIKIVERYANDMQVNDNWYAVAPNLIWPLDMVEPFSFLADIENVGGATQTGVTLTITIEDEGGNVVYTDDLEYGPIAPDSLAENEPFSGFFTPSAEGLYTGYYTISADSTDSNPNNDTISFQFLVSDTIFQKETGGNPNRPADGNWSAGDPWSWAYGNYFYVPDAGDNFFSYVSFAIDLSDAQSLAGEDLAIKIYEWVDVDSSGQAEPAERGEAIATMLYTMTGSETAANLISVPVTTLFGDPVPMQDETGYIVMVEYSASTEGTTIEMAFSNTVDYGAMILRSQQAGAPRYGSLLGIAGDLTGEPYSTLGFGYDFVPVVRVSFAELSSVRERIELPGKLSLFPNPSSNEINLDMDFDQTMQNVSVQLFNLNGQLLESRALQNVQQQTTSFNVQNLPNGAYVLKVTTEQGTRSEKFFVQH